jgi:hypothetical protein
MGNISVTDLSINSVFSERLFRYVTFLGETIWDRRYVIISLTVINQLHNTRCDPKV